MAAVVLALLAAATGYVAVGMRLYAQYGRAYGGYRVDPDAACGALLTWAPPADVFTALYVNEPQVLVVRYRSPHPQALRLTLSIPSFTQPQTFDLQATPAFQSQSFKPPLLGPAVLDALVGPRSRDAEIVLEARGNGADCDTSAPVQLQSRQLMQWQDAAGDDQSPYLAGWVTPQADAIGTLVGRTAQTLAAYPATYPAAAALYGYDDGQASPQAVVDQVNAIFDTLQFVYHLRYVDENVPYQQAATQLIQLPRDVLAGAAPTAMCVETTAIMASAVERIGMRPYIVIVPHHAFLGVALGPAPDAPLAYWETSDLNGGLRGDQANVHGANEYNQFQRQGQILRVIDVEAERARGIGPIE
jgi:hypothetical protein